MTLRQERGRYKASITKLMKSVSTSDYDESTLQEKLSHGKNAHLQILSLHGQILATLKDDVSIQEENMWLDDYSMFYAMFQEKVEEKIKTHKSQPKQDSEALISTMERLLRSIQTGQNASPFKLPPLTIPKFDGSYKAWISFRDLYTAAIHNNVKLTPGQKLQQLQGYLTGEAASCIRHIMVSDANYEKAWQLLTQRYDKHHSIITDHIETFLSIPRITQADKINVRQAYSTAIEVTNALEALNCTSKDIWLIHLLNERMDTETRKLWAEGRDDGLPTWEAYLKFLDKRCDTLQECCTSTNIPSSHGTNAPKKKSTALVATEANQCVCCKNSGHPLFKCLEFQQRSPIDRLTIVRDAGLCRNCISGSHLTANCTSTFKCKICHIRHNTMLHDAFASSRNDITTNSPADPTSEHSPGASSSSSTSQPTLEEPPRVVTPASVNVSSSAKTSKKIFLSTCVMKVFDVQKNVHLCRAIIDNGAQQTMMTEDLRARMQLCRLMDNTTIMGVNGKCSKVKGRTTICALSASGQDIFEFDCLIVPQLTGKLPNFPVDPSAIPIPDHIQLADPDWHKSSHVDMLIGMDYFNDIWQSGIIRLGQQLPLLRKTVFGWILSGVLHETINATQSPVVCNLTTSPPLETLLKRFWEVEEVELVKPQSIEHAEAEQHFVDTHSRDSSGRFVVHLPLKPSHLELGNSRGRAIRQLERLETQLDKDPQMRTLYNDCLQEYLDKGYMNEVEFKKDEASRHFYLPHHGVWKPSSTTTKLRVVFNASANSSTGLSLNDVLKVGATVQPDLVTILLRFRMHPYAMSCDVTKMYLQVQLHPPHARFQRIIWRSSSHLPLQDYQINRVCFGVASSPFLATRVLNELADNEQHELPFGSQAIKECFYVDDGLLACDSLESAQRMQSQLTEVMRRGGFSLAKWSANHPSLLEAITNTSADVKSISSIDSSVSVLGLWWNPQTDEFQYQIPPNFASPIATRQTIASAVARIYDPLGLLGPIITEGKVLIQASWKIRTDPSNENSPAVNWTTPLPAEIQERWSKFVDSLPEINNLRFPRWASTFHHPHSAIIHGFADASQSAYGATVYLVTSDGESSFSSQLLIAKSRVAPAKALTIPKLELCAAELCAHLVSRVQEELRISQAHLWSDSTIVLAWINSSSSQKHEVFVNHRLKKILKASNASQWNHVSSGDNPADLISRGCTPEMLQKSDLWFHGPSWLQLPPACHSQSNEQVNSAATKRDFEVSVNVVIQPADTLLQRLLSRCSRISRMEGILAQCLRYLTKPSSCRPKGSLSVIERDNALLHLIKLDQREHFGDLINALEKGNAQTNKRCKSFANLLPFLDSRGLIRVGGRLQRSQLTYDTKHPILLPHSLLTKLIAEREHSRQMHCGPQSLLAAMRQRFWPIRGRNLVRRIYRQCIQCFRVQPRLQQQIMGQLPEHRTSYSKPFAATSVDFAGPLQMKPQLKRGGPVTKVYVAIFVCHSTKAMHIELVSNLSTEAFLASFRRFVSRRSAPQHLYLDNATNFTGTATELSRLLAQESSQRSLQEVFVGHAVQFHFQPPEGPHHNGLVEAAVKSVKSHLHRVVGAYALTYEELHTVLTQIEAVLNSRPLMPLSSDPSDPPHLTPGHFLTGGPLTALPDPSLESINMNRLSQWQLCQRLSQDFATKWKRDYVHLLQERSKWKSAKPNVKIGDLALLAKDNVPGTQWPLGEIVNVYPGPDGYIRVIDIRVRSGTYRRPITKIALLPMDASMDPPEDVGTLYPTVKESGQPGC